MNEKETKHAGTVAVGRVNYLLVVKLKTDRSSVHLHQTEIKFVKY